MIHYSRQQFTETVHVTGEMFFDECDFYAGVWGQSNIEVHAGARAVLLDCSYRRPDMSAECCTVLLGVTESERDQFMETARATPPTAYTPRHDGMTVWMENGPHHGTQPNPA
jgi:hypothetical protein